LTNREPLELKGVQCFNSIKDPGCNDSRFIILSQELDSIVLPDPSCNPIVFSVNVSEIGPLKYRVSCPWLWSSFFLSEWDKFSLIYPILQ
jgi:hypothetical protein